MSAERQPANPRVFISYSRQDMAFVDRLQAALSERGIEAFVDRDDIEKGEAWWTRITQLISEADTIVFVLSPGSVDSKVCADEVAFAERLNKRFVPIVARDLDGRNVPKALARLNYVWFISNPVAEASGDFGEALDDLIRAIETDIAWIREHTRLGTLAARWEARKRSTELLLRGAELATAESWLTTRPEKAPNPTDAHRALITLSRQGAMRRQRIVVGASLAAIAVAGVLTSVALWQRSLAVAEGERALRNQRAAEAITREAQITQSGLLSESVRELLKLPGDSEAPLAMLLALEGMPDAQSDDGRQVGRPNVAEAQFQLDQAYFSNRERAVISYDSGVRTLAWSPDGSRLATGSGWVNEKMKTARIVNVTTGAELVRVPHEGIVWAVAWSPDGKRLATGSDDKTARIFDAATGNELARVAHESVVWALAWSPDGTRLASSSATIGQSVGLTRIVEALSGKELAQVTYRHAPGLDWRAPKVIWSTDGKRIAIGSTDNTIHIIDAAAGNELARIKQEGNVGALSWSPDGTRLATGSTDNTARIIDVASGRELVRVNHAGAVYAVSWSPDGTKLATGSSDKTARLLDAATGNELVRVVHNDSVLAVAWTPDGTRLATGSLDNSTRIISAATGMEQARVTCENMSGTASQNSDGTRTVGKCLPDAVVLSVAWSPDGTRLAVGSRERMGSRGNAFIFDATSWNLLARVTHSGAVEAMSWNPDGRRLATGSRDRTARIIDAATGNELGRITHAGSVTAMAWNLDGTRLATGSTDKAARIIEASSVKELARVTHEAPVAAVAWSPDGRGLATGSTDKSMRLWRIFPTSQALVDAAKSRATRCLTQTQRAQYFLPAAPPTWCVERRLWPYHGLPPVSAVLS